MMYFKLVKVFFKENFSFKQILGSNQKQSKVKKIFLGALIVYGLGSLVLSFGYMFFELGSLFKQMDSLNSLLTYIFMYATFLSAFFFIIRTSSYLLNYKDYDLLASMPIKNIEVVAAKISVMLVMIYLSIYILTAPIIFSYLYHGGFSLYNLLAILIGLLFIPIIPLIVFSLFALVFHYISSTLRIPRIVSLVFTFSLLIAFMYYSFSMNITGENPFINQEEMLMSISQYIPTVQLFFNAIANKDVLALLGFIGINILLFVGYLYLIQGITHRTNQNQTKTKKRRRRLSKYKERSVTHALISKEFNKLFSVNIYIFNTGFGILLMLVGGILSFVFSSKIEEFILELAQLNIQAEYIIIILVSFLLTTVYTSAVSLSLEGKNLWLIKSLPIEAKKIVLSKALFNIILGLPFALFFIISLAFVLKTNFVLLLLMILFVTSFSFVTSILGSIINLHFPKFNFKNETEVIKQSLGAFIGMFSGFGLLILYGVIYYFLKDLIQANWIILILTLINLAFFTLSYLYIDKKAESLFIHFY